MISPRLVKLVSYLLLRQAALPKDLFTRAESPSSDFVYRAHPYKSQQHKYLEPSESTKTIAAPASNSSSVDDALPQDIPVCLVVPGRGIVMEALCEALAKTNLGAAALVGNRLLYALDTPTGGVEHSADSTSEPRQGVTNASNRRIHWIDWNDHAGLSRLLNSETPWALVPVAIFERRGPARSIPPYRFGILRSLEFLIFRRRAAVLLSKPILVGKSSGVSLTRLVRLLKVERSRTLRLVRGVPFQSTRAQESQVLSGPEFERELALVAQRQRISLAEARSLTRKEFHQICAAPVRWIFTISSAIARGIIRQLFSEVSIVGMNQFTEAARDSAVVLVPMHRSHLDYILVGSVLYESRLNTPVVAAGLNLSFWPVGPIIRSLGAYFVRRNARNNRVHSLVLKRYVSYLTRRGHLQEFFIEGGRSRSGRMRAPKLGLLNVMVDACAKGLRKELLFIPVSISYENVVEERALAEENTGVKKRSESLGDLFSLPRVFRRSYGEVVLRFGRPLSLSNMLGRVSTSPAKLRPDTRTVVKELANALTTRLRSQSSISLSGLICSALLAAPRYGMTLKELEARLVSLAKLAQLARLRNPELGSFTSTLEVFLQRPEALRSIAQARSGMLQVHRVVDEEIVFIPGPKRYRADFYRNTCHHVFFPIGIVAVTLRCQEYSLDDVISLVHAAFEHEFLLGTKEEFVNEVLGMRDILIAEGWIKFIKAADAQTIREAADGEAMQCSEQLAALSTETLLLVPLESMLWVAELLASNSYEAGTGITGAGIPSTGAPGATIPYKEFITRAQLEFRPAAYRTGGGPSRTESGSQSNIAGGLEMLHTLGLIEIHEGTSGPSAIISSKYDPAILAPYRMLADVIRSGHCDTRKSASGKDGSIEIS